jgi:hypothetical protein
MLMINDVTSLSSRLACVLGLLVFSIVGCSDLGSDGDDGTGMGGMAGTGGTGATGGDPDLPPVTLFVTTLESPSFEDLWPGPPLEGVEVCETDTDNCAVSDANGKATIDVPAYQEISFTLEKEGYVPSIVPRVTDETLAPESWGLVREELVADFSGLNMIPYPWTGGVLFLAAFPRTAGVTYDLVDETARVFYRDEAGTAKFDLTATTCCQLGAGLGGFVEVAPGEYQVEFGGTATNCILMAGWPGDAENRVRVPMKVGYITYADMRCEYR